MAEAVNASSSAPVAGATRVWCPNADRRTEARHLFVQRESADDQVPVRFQSFIASFVGQSHCSGWLLFFQRSGCNQPVLLVLVLMLQPFQPTPHPKCQEALELDTSPSRRHKRSLQAVACVYLLNTTSLYISLSLSMSTSMMMMKSSTAFRSSDIGQRCFPQSNIVVRFAYHAEAPC